MLWYPLKCTRRTGVQIQAFRTLARERIVRSGQVAVTLAVEKDPHSLQESVNSVVMHRQYNRYKQRTPGGSHNAYFPIAHTSSPANLVPLMAIRVM